MADAQPSPEPSVSDDPAVEESITRFLDLSDEASTTSEDTLDEAPFVREDIPGRPVCAVPVVSVEGLAPADHVILETSQEPCRPCYQSGLVVEIDVQKGRMLLIRYKKEGVSKEWIQFETFQQVYLVQYTLCQYSEEEAIGRAEQRFRWEESLYHPLLNNSHHLVTWAKTGREYPLTDIVKDLEYAGNCHPLDPVLMKVKVETVEDLKPGDHIMGKSNHWLIKSVDLQHKSYVALKWNGKKVIEKERKFKGQGCTTRVEYDSHSIVFPADTVLINAAKAVESRETFSSSEEFVITMKIGKRHTFDDSCIFSGECGHVSYTHITADVAIDEGDHLVVKDTKGKFHSILLYKYIGKGIMVTMPDIKNREPYGEIRLTDFEEAYRINYQESLPVDTVLKRACSQTGESILKACLHVHESADHFISWAKTGQKWLADINKLRKEMKAQIAQLRPWERIKVGSYDEIEVGDHLIQHIHGHWFHFMVTECNANPNEFKIIYCHNGSIGERVAPVNPRKNDIFKILHPECLPAELAIQRARSRLGTHKLSPLARMWFVRWAKTGSDEGLEVGFLPCNISPVTKSEVVSFSQLNPGDYLVEKRGKPSHWHHYLVTEVLSPTQCSVIGSWGALGPHKVSETHIMLMADTQFYRVNYSDEISVSPSCAVAAARTKVGRSFHARSKYTRQKFVNRIKTREAIAIEVDGLLDDRTFLPRQKVQSSLDLKPGDLVEVSITGEQATFQHMLVVEILEKECIRVLACPSCTRKRGARVEDVNLSDEGLEVFRVVYAERLPPHESLQLEKVVSSAATQGKHPTKKGKCILVATFGDTATSISLNKELHRALEYKREDVHKPITIALGYIATSLTSRQLTRAKITDQAGKESAVKTATRASLKIAFKLSQRLVLTTIGAAAGGVGVGFHVLAEGPILARGLYKLHRKKKFDQISETEHKQEIIKETVGSANAVVGAAGGAIVGQILIPIPGVGACIGGAVGTIAGEIAGNVEGRALARRVHEKILTLPVILRYSFTDVSPVCVT